MSHFIFDARTATPHFPGIGRYVNALLDAMPPLLQTDETLTVLQDSHAELQQTAILNHTQLKLIYLAATPFSLRQQWVIPAYIRRQKKA
ncbi:MAG: hypothetical protein R2911_46350, partial [Caldilineaceae bacterium]